MFRLIYMLIDVGDVNQSQQLRHRDQNLADVGHFTYRRKLDLTSSNDELFLEFPHANETGFAGRFCKAGFRKRQQN
jgi:hypothetical protein